MNFFQQLFHLSGCSGTNYTSLPAGQSQTQICIAIGMNKPTHKYISLSFYAWTTIAVFSDTIMYKILTEILHSFNHSMSSQFLHQQSNQEAACNTEIVQVSPEEAAFLPRGLTSPSLCPLAEWATGAPPHRPLPPCFALLWCGRGCAGPGGSW